MLVNDPILKKTRSFPHAEIEGPCFLLTITATKTENTNRAALLECAFTLHHYLLAVNDVEIKHIHMMCPPSITGNSHWVLEELISVTFIEETRTKKGGIIYQTKESVYKIGDFDHDHSMQGHVIFSVQNLQSQVPKTSNHHSDPDSHRLIGPID